VTTYQLAELKQLNEDIYVRVAGTVLNLSRKVSRKGDSYARFDLEDLSGRMEIMVFPSAFRNNIDRLGAEQAVVVEGFLDTRDEQPKISLRRVEALPARLQELHVRISGDNNGNGDAREGLLTLLEKFPGEIEVFLHLPDRRVIALKHNYQVAADPVLKDRLAEICGRNNVWYS